VVAVSDVARQCGIARGWAPQRALSLVPHAVALPHDAAACAFAWEQVLAALYEHTPRIEAVREGLAFFEVPTRKEAQQVLAVWVARTDACCGAATSRALAELAALSAPTGIVRCVRTGRESSFLNQIPVETLCEAGISSHTIERLQWFGLLRVRQLKSLSRRQLCEQFEDGAKVWRFARADDLEVGKQSVLPYVPPPAIEVRLSFEQAATQPHEWEAALDELLQRACGELNGRGASSLSIAVGTKNGRHATSRLLREPISIPRSLREPARAMICELLADDAELHALEIRLGNLSTNAKQGVLFETGARREDALLNVLHRLEARHNGAVRRIRARDLHSPLPEERFALVPWLDAVSRLEAASRKALSKKPSSKKATKR